MKKLLAPVMFFLTICIQGHSQTTFEPESIAAVFMESRNISIDGMTAGDILRNELIKTERFRVIDRYETKNACETLDINPEECLGRSCLTTVGEHLRVQKMISGNIDRYAQKIIITLRVIDVANGQIERNFIQEFIDVDQNLPTMLRLSVFKMFDLSFDKVLWERLTNENDYENTVNTPEVTKLSLSGPRMGFGFVMGVDGSVLTAKEEVGGFDAWPAMAQFGYQFEVSYLNQGNVQALFEFVPTITGLEQGLFIPSVSILHGIRSNVSGLEFAFGPIFIMTKKAKGFEVDGEWYLEDQRQDFPNESLNIEKRLDSRGDLTLDSGLVLAVGRTFKSGKVNFPVNVVTVLKKSGIRLGVSFGFNASQSARK